MNRFILALWAALAAAVALAHPVHAQEPLRITITDPTIEPIPFAIPAFTVETAGAEALARDIAGVVAADLVGSGLFAEIPPTAFINPNVPFNSAPTYTDWTAINAQALITGAVAVSGDQLTVKFRLYDVFSGAELGEGLQFAGTAAGWRRMGHKVADAVYSRITGEGGYFDSRVIFVSESGPKDARAKRLAIMDYDGAGVQYLTSRGCCSRRASRPRATGCSTPPTSPACPRSTSSTWHRSASSRCPRRPARWPSRPASRPTGGG
jgi:TolB protein